MNIIGMFGTIFENGFFKNLYDVAGNVWEWSAETVISKTTQANVTIGNKLQRGSGYPASFRSGYGSVNYYSKNVGFRFVLYIK